MMVPEMKCELDLYEYVLVHTSTYFSTQVRTQYVLFYQSTYSVHTILPEYVLGIYHYVLCLQKYCRGCFLCRMKVGNNTVYA